MPILTPQSSFVLPSCSIALALSRVPACSMLKLKQETTSFCRMDEHHPQSNWMKTEHLDPTLKYQSTFSKVVPKGASGGGVLAPATRLYSVNAPAVPEHPISDRRIQAAFGAILGVYTRSLLNTRLHVVPRGISDEITDVE